MRWILPGFLTCGSAPTRPTRPQEASLGQAPPLTDEQLHEHLRHTALHLQHEFKEANKRALLNVVSGKLKLRMMCWDALLHARGVQACGIGGSPGRCLPAS